MVRLPGTATVLSTSPNGKLYTCDAFTGRLRTGKRVAGELRSVVFDDEVGGADGAWALATFGLCRISLNSLARTGDNVRKGIGKYQGRMVALSEDMLAVSAFYGRSMTLISHLVAYDRYTLTELWRTTAPGHGIEVLGQDRDGRITVACHSTVTVVNPSTGGVDGVYRHPGGIGGALLMPEHNTVLLKNRAADPQALTVLRWRPDPRVATVTDTGG